MEYRLYKNSDKEICDIPSNELIPYLLKNRGVNQPYEYMRISNYVDDMFDEEFKKLSSMRQAVELFMHHYNSRNPIEILVDTDVDGFCSASMMYSYIKKQDKNYPVNYILHKLPKSHGLNDDIQLREDTRLLIIPDAGTNDTFKCKELAYKGINILVLDHHQRDESIPVNEYAVVVNNQTSDEYCNKDFCGAGIVYRFLQALDLEFWAEDADCFLDLVALANISDVMDIRSLETKSYITRGLSNIQNKMFLKLLEAQEYSTKGKINIHNIQFYITPVLNGLIRIGNAEEQDIMFRAFIEDESKTFEYKKRATKTNPAMVIEETIYERAVRLAKNAKSRQDRMRTKSTSSVCDLVDAYPTENKVIICDVSDALDKSLTGLVAIRIAEKYNRPCLLVKRYFDKELDRYVYGGSARNFNYSPIDDLKSIINDTGKFYFARGHENAFGVCIDADEKDINNVINEANEVLNDVLKDIVYDSTYRVDFILDEDTFDVNTVRELSKFESYVGNMIDESFCAIENLNLNRSDFNIIGTKEDTIVFRVNDVEFIRFRCDENDELYSFLNNAWDDNDNVTITVVGVPSISEYGGMLKPQFIIKDVNVLKSSLDGVDGNPTLDTFETDDFEW